MPAFVSALPDVGRAAYGLINVGRRGRGYGEITQCRGECWSDGEAAWSPGRDRIAFSRVTGPRSAPGPSRVAIDVANADGGLADEIDAARAEAVKGLRAYSYSWAEIGSRLGHHRAGRPATLGITSRARPCHTRQRPAVSHGHRRILLSLDLWV